MNYLFNDGSFEKYSTESKTRVFITTKETEIPARRFKIKDEWLSYSRTGQVGAPVCSNSELDTFTITGYVPARDDKSISFEAYVDGNDILAVYGEALRECSNLGYNSVKDPTVVSNRFPFDTSTVSTICTIRNPTPDVIYVKQNRNCKTSFNETSRYRAEFNLPSIYEFDSSQDRKRVTVETVETEICSKDGSAISCIVYDSDKATNSAAPPLISPPVIIVPPAAPPPVAPPPVTPPIDQKPVAPSPVVPPSVELPPPVTPPPVTTPPVTPPPVVIPPLDDGLGVCPIGATLRQQRCCYPKLGGGWMCYDIE
jgi:hypothetical protein